MGLKLVCTADFHGHRKGQEVTDPAEVARHLAEREHCFVKVWAPTPPPAPPREAERGGDAPAPARP